MKRSKYLEPLSHDHFEGLLVARRLKSGLKREAPAGEMAAFVVHFWDEYLTHHFGQEEMLLIEPLEQTKGSELAERMVAEHRAFRKLVDVLRDSDGPLQADAAAEHLTRFAADLPAHIRFEERELFPHLEEHLDEATLAAVGAQLEAAHVDADLSWPAAFWEE